MSKKPYLKTEDHEFWKQLQWEPSLKQLNQFIELQELIRNWNKKVNLTRLIEGEDYWIGQIFDSLWPFKKELYESRKELRCIDVGTGCGLPGLAIAIALPYSNVTLLDSVKKKTLAVEEIASCLGISSRIKVVNKRAEVLGHDDHFRNKYDLAMARAVAPAPVVAEYLVPFLNIGGEAILFRGHWYRDDEENLYKALALLNARIVNVDRCSLPKGRGIRTQIRLQRNASCPENFPRDIGVPAKKPLGNQDEESLF